MFVSVHAYGLSVVQNVFVCVCMWTYIEHTSSTNLSHAVLHIVCVYIIYVDLLCKVVKCIRVCFPFREEEHKKHKKGQRERIRRH